MLRSLRAVLLVVVPLALAVVVAGCGGQKVSADEVPGAPVALTVPEVTKGGSDILAGGSSSSNSGSAGSSSSSSSDDTSTSNSGSATATATATPQTTTAPSQGNTTTGGATGNTGQTNQGTNTGQSQTGGQPFDDFCKNNPGAC